MKKRAIVLIGMFVCTLFVFTTTLSAAPDIFGSTSGTSLLSPRINNSGFY